MIIQLIRQSITLHLFLNTASLKTTLLLVNASDTSDLMNNNPKNQFMKYDLFLSDFTLNKNSSTSNFTFANSKITVLVLLTLSKITLDMCI